MPLRGRPDRAPAAAATGRWPPSQRLMSARFLKILAAGLLIGSLMLVAIALNFGRAPKTPPAPTEAPRHPVVTAVRPIQPGETIGEADVLVSMLANVPPDAIQDRSEAVGSRPAAAIPAGTPLLHAHFPPGNALAKALSPGERAIALKVDEVVGVGGFLQSGDRVDVITYLRGDDRQSRKEQAVVVLQAVRVLAYGEDLPPAPGTPTAAAGKAAKSRKGRGTAVVAVDASGAARLTLAEQVGSLRLALQPTGSAETAGPRAVTLDDLAALVAKSAPPAKPKGRVVELYRGPKLTEIELQ